MLMNLFKFKGGVKPPTNKTQSNHLPIAHAPLPSRLVVPLHQSIGGTPRPVVSAGDQVLKGQLIGEADGWISAAVHAPTSGTVLEVAMYVQPHPSGLDALCVVIAPDGRHLVFERDFTSASAIVTVRPDGSHLRRLTTGSHFDLAPAWSPDGSRIAFGSDRTSWLVDLWVMRADGTRLRELFGTPKGGESNPDW
mgnify:CR=1 FL=1